MEVKASRKFQGLPVPTPGGSSLPRCPCSPFKKEQWSIAVDECRLSADLISLQLNSSFRGDHIFYLNKGLKLSDLTVRFGGILLESGIDSGQAIRDFVRAWVQTIGGSLQINLQILRSFSSKSYHF